MMILSRMLYFATAFAALPCVLAAPMPRSSSCEYDVQAPPAFTESMQLQWCGMITNEVAGLKQQEAISAVLPLVDAMYKQANIQADPESAFPNLDQLTQEPSVHAALTQMKANYPLSGSMDLTEENIRTVYGDHIQAACAETGVPEDIIVTMIWVESKGHPLVYGALTQMDHVAWGRMMDMNVNLKNRYMPGDNIMAAAMYLRESKDTFDCDWQTAYTQHYQDPTAKARGY